MYTSNETTDYREILERDGFFMQFPAGVSMRPMLKQGRDTIVIEKLKQSPKENDVVLYQTDAGKYILHRVIKVKDEGYVIRGDNRIKNEYDVKDRHIIGILTGFYRKDKYINCYTNKWYKFYVIFWRNTFFIRVLFMYPYRCIRRILSKIKHKIFK